MPRDVTSLGRNEAPPIPAARLLVPGLLLYVVVKLGLFAALALNTAYIPDEYVFFDEVERLSEPLYRESWPAKPLLYACYFALAYLVGESSVELLHAARLLSALASMVGLGLLYAVARSIGWSRLEALFAIAIVLSFAGYSEWAFMVRPEPLAACLGIAALLWIVRRAARWRAVLLAGVFGGLAFLATQKAVYIDLALGLALVGDAALRRRPLAVLGDGAALVIGWAATIAAYAGVFALQGADFVAVLRHLFLGPVLENAVSGHLAYAQDLRGYVPQVLLRDPILYALGLAGLAVAAPAVLRRPAPDALRAADPVRRAWVFALVVVALVFAHRSPWPYNFVLAIPFLGLWAPRLLRAVPAQPALRAGLVGLVAAAFAFSLVRTGNVLTGHTNAFQNLTVARAEALLAPDDAYFDGLDLVVTRPRAGTAWWDRATINRLRAAANEGDTGAIKRIFAGAPKLWILSYRTEAVKDLLTPYFERGYVAIYPNILIAGAELDPDAPTAFHAYWPGRYRIYDAKGAPVSAAFEIDGVAVVDLVVLQTGRHVIRVPASDAPLYLLPADVVDASFDMTADRAPRPLFVDSYSY